MEQHQSSVLQPPQHQDRQPGIESAMTPRPTAQDPSYRGSGKLHGKVALITGGDSGIGRAAALCFAREGADVAIVYLNEHDDAAETKGRVEAEGRRCVTFAGDVGLEPFCQEVVQQTVAALGQLDILVNNAAEQHPQDSLAKITAAQLERTFRTNIFAYFYLSKAALPHFHAGSAIINTTSVTAYRGSPHLLDYAATKGAIVAFTRSLALALADQGIRVNGVAPGPIWTPLIPSTFDEDTVAHFGADVPLQRAGQPEEIAPSGRDHGVGHPSRRRPRETHLRLCRAGGWGTRPPCRVAESGRRGDRSRYFVIVLERISCKKGSLIEEQPLLIDSLQLSTNLIH